MLGSGCWPRASGVCGDPVVWELLRPSEAPGSTPIASDNMAGTKEGFSFNVYLVYMLYSFPKPSVKL